LPSKSLDTNFTDRLRGLRGDMSATASAARGVGGGRWAHCTEQAGPAPDHTSIHTHFTRDALGKRYEEQRSDASVSAAYRLRVVTLQHDWLAGMERDYRLRHRPRLRNMAHATALRAGLGVDGGVLDTCGEKLASFFMSYEDATGTSA